jgi:hypothetical protein
MSARRQFERFDRMLRGKFARKRQFPKAASSCHTAGCRRPMTAAARRYVSNLQLFTHLIPSVVDTPSVIIPSSLSDLHCRLLSSRQKPRFLLAATKLMSEKAPQASFSN